MTGPAKNFHAAMPVDISEFIQPQHTAVIVSECQESVLGEGSPLQGLKDMVNNTGMVDNLSSLLDEARKQRIKVFHCTVERREDGYGDPLNTPLTRMMARHGGPSSGMAPGSKGARPLSALAPQADDIHMPRLYGITAFHETGLDHFLRNSGIKTVIFTGVSLNLAVIGGTLEAVNRGYTVVIPTDCVAADSEEYAGMILKHSLRNIAYTTDSQTIKGHWQT
jgi:nicotinamidase-related amidase